MASLHELFKIITNKFNFENLIFFSNLFVKPVDCPHKKSDDQPEDDIDANYTTNDRKSESADTYTKVKKTDLDAPINQDEEDENDGDENEDEEEEEGESEGDNVENVEDIQPEIKVSVINYFLMNVVRTK